MSAIDELYELRRTCKQCAAKVRDKMQPEIDRLIERAEKAERERDEARGATAVISGRLAGRTALLSSMIKAHGAGAMLCASESRARSIASAHGLEAWSSPRTMPSGRRSVSWFAGVRPNADDSTTAVSESGADQ